MLIAALCAFAAAATAGLFLAYRHFTRKKLPASIALLHGLGGATGFLFVLLVVVQDPGFRLARQALYLFMVTILLGAVNLLFHLRKKRHRTSLIVLHAAVAVSGVLTLVLAIFSGESNATAQPVATHAPIEPAPSAAPVDVAAKVPEPRASAAPAASAPAVAEPAAPVSAKVLAVDGSVRDALEQSIRFDTRSAAIAAESQSAIVAIAKALKDHPELVLVEVQGHADERGNDAQNVALTQGRAAAVVEALVGRGVERARLHAAGYGARCPADAACRSANAPDACRSPDRYASDRRVVFVPLRVGTTSLAGEVVCARGAELIPPADRAFHIP
ncbi:MAG TPA: OmpA family protein [Polyangiaceae bacterium]|nr:OmpA family protein [Polyangiaceae bacterium]